MKKIVFFDVDGTLVTRNNHIPKSTKKAINTLKDKVCKEEIVEAEATTKECPYCCSTIAINAKRCPNCTSEL